MVTIGGGILEALEITSFCIVEIGATWRDIVLAGGLLNRGFLLLTKGLPTYE